MIHDRKKYVNSVRLGAHDVATVSGLKQKMTVKVEK